MTKLNHNRPNLRYLDNLRREIRREDRPAPRWFEPERIEVLGVRLADPEKLPRHIEAFARLDQRQGEIAGCAIEEFGLYLEATTSVVSLLIGGNSKERKAAKEAQTRAKEKALVTGAVLAGTIIADLTAGRSGFWEWFQDFYGGLDQQSKFAWSEFAEMVFGESLELWVAQQLADTPEGVEQWRSLLASEILTEPDSDGTD